MNNNTSHPESKGHAARDRGIAPLGEPSDAALLALVAQKDQSAFAALYDRFAARMFGLILKLVPQRIEAEDVLQEVFLHIWKGAGSYNPSLGSPPMWMMLVTRGRSIDYLRRRGSHAAAVASLQARTSPNGSNGHAHGNGNGVAANHSQDLSRLPAEQFEAISLAYHGGLTCAQIADLRQLPIGTVKTRIRLGMRKLRELAESTDEVTRP